MEFLRNARLACLLAGGHPVARHHDDRVRCLQGGVATPVMTLAKGEELIFMGKEQDGFVGVETAKGAGWVKKVLVTR